MIHCDLSAALDAVSIDSPDCYTVCGERRDLRDLPAPPDGTAVLPTALESDLYRRLYMRPGRHPAPGDVLAQRHLVAALSAANVGRGTWEPRWQIGEVDQDGRIAVTKDGLTFWVQPSGLRSRDGRITPGASCRVRVGKEIRGLVPGFYLAIGDSEEDDPSDDSEPLVRLYFHLVASAAVAYMAAATRHLNAAGIPFRTKVVNDPSAYQRADVGVLYLSRRHYGGVCQILPDLLKALAGGLRSEVPLFTKRLAAGLGLAEDPLNGMSFGQHRCGLIARALWNAFQGGHAGRSEREAAIAATFREASLDPMLPYLGPGSSDAYEFRHAVGVALLSWRCDSRDREPSIFP